MLRTPHGNDYGRAYVRDRQARNTRRSAAVDGYRHGDFKTPAATRGWPA
ncbi:hypothetical protein SNL152K_1143 [Streptomyces sp. NL15-2K]|nr:hypothetical protein SNL152K_1143 [Streptomyces sp. NL15-2K]